MQWGSVVAAWMHLPDFHAEVQRPALCVLHYLNHSNHGNHDTASKTSCPVLATLLGLEFIEDEIERNITGYMCVLFCRIIKYWCSSLITLWISLACAQEEEELSFTLSIHACYHKNTCLIKPLSLITLVLPSGAINSVWVQNFIHKH